MFLVESIIDVLNKNKDWNALVIGDEAREKLNFIHDRLNLLGFKDNRICIKYSKKN